MAIVGIGVDVVDLARFEQVLKRTPDMVNRLFTAAEQTSAAGHQLPVMSLAGRFAVKEAVAKAVGAPAGMEFHDCEVSNGGAPKLTIVGPDNVMRVRPYHSLVGRTRIALRSDVSL